MSETKETAITPVRGGIEEGRGEPGSVTWEAFLSALERICDCQGWQLEYDGPHDESCAIFSEGALVPQRAGGEENHDDGTSR